MALSQNERRVLDRWDAGQAMRRIACETGLTFARVSKIVETYHSRPEARNHRTRMAHSSALLRTAILAQSSSPSGQQGASA